MIPPQISLLLLTHLLLLAAPPASSQPPPPPPTAATGGCPLNFTVLQKFIDASMSRSGGGNSTDDLSPSNRCTYTLQGIHLVQAEYLRTAGLFLPPANSSAACWDALNPFIAQVFPGFDPRASCGFRTEWISQGCMNISSLSQFQTLVSPRKDIRDEVNRNCNISLANSAPCAACTASLSALKAAFLTGPDFGNVSKCDSYSFIYAAGAVNPAGPADDGNALCFFLIDSKTAAAGGGGGGGGGDDAGWIFGVVAGSLLFLVLAGVGSWILLRRRRRRKRRKRRMLAGPDGARSAALEFRPVGESTTLARYTIEQIKAATNNFSRENIIGMGGYGNVYKGLLPDGTEVALKRFKNCSAAGDESFRHEVEVIASVRHVNLLGLKGYCIATTALEGHQRIIVCDLMKNGSLHDHLFGLMAAAEGRKLSWPARQKIAVGTARGLAYLHYGVQPGIIHRDIKASNILLDEEFEPKVADFGLAKFAPEGVSHLSTRVAGTHGYVAPEYALYGQLTEKSDVYSFGVLLLELLSGKKAIISMAEQPSLVADWAWSQVRRGRVLDVIEDGIDQLGPKEVMEKYVLVAVLASHPQMHARPTMDQIVKILEAELAVPSIPDRPIPLTSNMSDIERSVSSSGSGQLSSFAGYQPFTIGCDDSSSD